MNFKRPMIFTIVFWVASLLLSACTVPQQVAVPAANSSAGQVTTVDRGSAALEGATTFQIIAEESEARFRLGEVFLGTPKDVVGATRQFSGEITVNPSNPAASSVGIIQIDAASLATDNERRDAAVRRFILQTDEYPTITLAPSALDGMPASVAVGDNFSFHVIGDLQIRNIVHPVTFDVTVNVLSDSELTGSANAVIFRSDYELTIPNVPSVTDVSDEVELSFDFTARAN
ncbi:MAG: YceI family protein [Caldilineaceae bacterium]|nr:YceI family protein [Caldilineaceae bacterium]